jgi:hypothetical protein
MGIRDRYARTKAETFLDNIIHLEDQLSRGRIKISSIPTQYIVRTYCPDCDEPCNAIRYHGQRLLIVAIADTWVPHQCPQPIEPRERENQDGDTNRSGLCEQGT